MRSNNDFGSSLMEKPPDKNGFKSILKLVRFQYNGLMPFGAVLFFNH